MNEYKFTSNGTDQSFLVNANLFLAVLFTLAVFRDRWADDKLGSQSVLQRAFDWYKETFEGGQTGNRVQIAARKLARQELDLRIQKILHYLAVMADDNDINAILKTGVVKPKMRKKTRRAPRPAVTAN